MLVAFELVTGSGWPSIMLQAVNGGAGDGHPRINANPSATLYFVVSQLVLKSFVIEMFTSIVIDTYFRLRDERQGAVLLTSGQRVSDESFQFKLRVLHYITFFHVDECRHGFKICSW
jgi:hypothetical protein